MKVENRNTVIQKHKKESVKRKEGRMKIKSVMNENKRERRGKMKTDWENGRDRKIKK